MNGQHESCERKGLTMCEILMYAVSQFFWHWAVDRGNALLHSVIAAGAVAETQPSDKPAA